MATNKMTRDEAISLMEDNLDQIKELLQETLEAAVGAGADEDRCRRTWYAHIQCSLDHDHSWLDRSSAISDTIEELRALDEADEETGCEGDACPDCGSTETWVATFCNFGHCAICFAALNEEHECGWDGREHESYGPTDKLPGNVHIREDEARCTICRRPKNDHEDMDHDFIRPAI